MTGFLTEAKLRSTFTFGQMWELGWRTLIPVVPPGAKLSPNSKLDPGDIGKVPGRKYLQGWGGFPDWQNIKPARADYEAWEAMGASIGCRCDEVVGIDCDIPDVELSRVVRDALARTPDTGIGSSPVIRVGVMPKWLMPVRVVGGAASVNLNFKHKALPHGHFQVQLLGKGKQFVAWGIHPKTHELYKWSSAGAPPAFSSLPLLTAANLDAVRACITRALVDAGAEPVSSSSGADPSAPAPNQDQLKGEPLQVRDALLSIPNDLDYDTWQFIAAALRGASQDWPAAGLELFLEFTSRCTRVAPDLDNARRKYESYRPPFRLGAQYIFDKAASHGFNKAAVDFEALASPEPPTPREDAVHWGDHVHAAMPENTSEQSRYSDQALAHRFAAGPGARLVYVGELGLWHGWDGQRWRADNTKSLADVQLADFLVKEAARAKAKAAETKEEKKEQQALVKRLLSATQLKNVGQLIRPMLTISYDALDVDKWALNTPEGLLDLRTGDMVTHDRRRYVTRMTRVGPAPLGSPPPPRWLRFLDEVTQGDDELVRWLQRALGYTLSGELPDHTVFFLYGPGGNGKSVLLDTVFDLMGSYATVADRAVFLKQRFESHATVRASLAGARMIVVPEIPAGAEWNDALLKEFSAGNPIKARFIAKNEFTYIPQGTLWFSGNDQPSLAKVDPAIERRFRLITFDYSPPRPDPHLRKRLVEQEGPAILRWLLDGYRMWAADGLGTARAVEQGTQDYFAHFDPIRSWAQDRCVRGPEERDGSTELFEDYQRWWKDNMASGVAGELLSHRAFSLRLSQLSGVTAARAADRRLFKGIARRLRAVDTGKEKGAPEGPVKVTS